MSHDRSPRDRSDSNEGGFLSTLSAFMVERNIFWGELVGGLLVIGGALALVISLWDTFRDSPIFRLEAFTGATITLLLIGIYTSVRLKLQATSKGLLWIGMLLVPIQLLGVTLPGRGSTSPTFEMALVGVSLLLLAWPVWRAARILAEDCPGTVTLGLLLTALCQAPVAWLADAGAGGNRFLMLAILAVLCQVVPALFLLARLARTQPLHASHVQSWLVFLGVTLFSLAVVLVFEGLLGATQGFSIFSIPIALVGLPILTGGALLHHRLGIPSEEDAHRQAGYRTVGTILALSGMVIEFAVLWLAWPDPSSLLFVSLFIAVALTAIAFLFEVPFAHLLGIPCWVMCYLLAVGLLGDYLPRAESHLAAPLVEFLCTTVTGLLLLIPLGMSLGLVEYLGYRNRAEHQRAYAIAAFVLAGASAVLLTIFGVQNPVHALLGYTALGSGLLLFNLRWQRVEASYVALGLLVGASFWAVWLTSREAVVNWGLVFALDGLLLLVWGNLQRRWTSSLPWLHLGIGAAGLALLCEGSFLVRQEWASLGEAWQHTVVFGLLAAWAYALAGIHKQEELARLGTGFLVVAVSLFATWMNTQVFGWDTHLVFIFHFALVCLSLVLGPFFLGNQTPIRTAVASSWREAAILCGVITWGLLAFHPPEMMLALPVGGLVLAGLLLARERKEPIFAHAALLSSLVFLVELFAPVLAEVTAQAVGLILLSHATTCLFVGLLITRFSDKASPIREWLVDPLGVWVLISSVAAVGPLSWGFVQSTGWVALECLWLSILWTVLCFLRRSPTLFFASQVTLLMTVVLAVDAWLRASGFPLGHHLQIYGLCISLFVLLATIVRRLTRDNSLLRELREHSLPLDRVLFPTLLVGHALLVGLSLAPSVWTEASSLAIEFPLTASLQAWLAWGTLLVLGIALLVDRREYVIEYVLACMLVLGLQVCMLLAYPIGQQHAGASALSWVLALGFIVFSLPVWWRHRLGEWAPQELEIRRQWSCLLLVRGGLVLGTALPVLVLLVVRVWLSMVGRGGPGPDADSLFARMGTLINGMGPSALVCVGLWAYALRDRRAEYALGVSLLVSGLASLIYVFLNPAPSSSLPWWFLLVEMNAIVLMACGLLWLCVRSRIAATTFQRVLFSSEVILASLLQVLIFLGLFFPVLANPHPGLGNLEPYFWLAGLALGLWAVLLIGHALLRGNGLASALAVVGLAAGILAARCAPFFLGHPWASLHALQLMWFALAGGFLLYGWTTGTPERRTDIELSLWFGIVSLLVGSLFLWSLGDERLAPWWTAGGWAAVSLVLLGFARWKRSEPAVLGSAVVLHLALAIVQVYFLTVRGMGLEEVPIGSPHLVLAALFGMAWLLGHRRLYPGQRVTPETRPVLTLYVLVLGVGQLAVLLGPLVLLLRDPVNLSPWIRQAGDGWTWASFALTTLVATLYTDLRFRDWGVHLLRGLGVALCLMIAYTAARFDTGNWLAYHVLQTGGLALAGAILIPAWLRDGRREHDPALIWVVALGACVLALTMHGVADDPGMPWWPAGYFLGLGLLAALLAGWQREGNWAFLAIVALNIAIGLPLFHHHRLGLYSFDFATLLRIHVLTTMAATGAWLILGRLRSEEGKDYTHPLLMLLLAAGVAVCVYLLAYPLVMLIINPVVLAPVVRETGSLLSLLTLASVASVLALNYRPKGGWRAVPAVTALITVAGVLAACVGSVGDTGNWLSYTILTSTWMLGGPAILLLGVVLSRRQYDLPEADLRKLRRKIRWWADGCVAGLALAVVLLAIRGFLGDAQLLPWCLLWIGAITVEAAVMALWRRSETWAVLTTLGIDLLISLFLWDAPPLNERAPFWMWLLQANVLTTSLAALLWLVAARRIYGEERPQFHEAPLLSFQVLFTILGNVVLLLNPSFLGLLQDPGRLSPEVSAADGIWGWLTFGLTVVTVLVYLRLTRMHEAVHVLGTVGMGAGVLAACTAAHFDHGQWLSYHVLMLSWTIVGAMILLGGWLESHRRTAPPEEGERPWISIQVVQAWLAVSGLPVLALALRGVLDDPAGAWWSSGVIAALSVLAAMLGIWRQRVLWTSLASLGVNLSLSLAVWRAHQGVPFADWSLLLVQVNVLAFSGMGLLWLLLIIRLDRESLYARRSLLCVDALLMLATLGLAVVLVQAGTWLILRPVPFPVEAIPATTALAWSALLVTLLAWRGLSWVRGRRLSEGRISLGGLCLSIALACTLGNLEPNTWLGYHVLIVCLAALAGLLLVRKWQPEGVNQFLDPTSGWIGWWGVVLIGLGLRSGLVDASGPWWSAGAIAASAILFAGLAFQRRREGWAFFAGLSTLLAVSLVFVRFHLDQPFDEWRTELLRLNVIAMSITALLWLFCRHRLYADRPPATSGNWLLTYLVLLAAGNLALWVEPVAYFLQSPGELHPVITRAGGALSWAALGISILPVGWYFRRMVHDFAIDFLCLLAVGISVLLACTVARHVQDGWLAYRVLMLSGAPLAFALLLVGWRGQLSDTAANRLLTWIVLLSLGVLGLGVRAAVDVPSALTWPSIAGLSVSALWLGVGSWRRDERWLLLAGLIAVICVQGLTWTTSTAGVPFEVFRFQLAVITAGSWALLWLLVTEWRMLDERRQPVSLLDLQVWGGFMLGVVPLVYAGGLIFLQPNEPHSLVQVWGSLAGRGMVLLSLLALIWHVRKQGQLGLLESILICLLTLTLLLACAAAHASASPVVVHRVVLVGILLAGLCATLWGWMRADRESSALLSRVEAYGSLFFALTVALAVRTIGSPAPDAGWWSAGAVLGVSAACLALARLTARQIWTLSACLGAHLALTLVFWRENHPLAWEEWGLSLLQANALLGGVCALLWLAIGRDESPSENSPQCAYLYGLVLVVLGLAVIPLGRLVWSPAPLHPSVVRAGTWIGWLSLLMIFAAVLWRGGTGFVGTIHALRYPLALTLGVMLACSFAPWDHGRWLSYHVLVLAWLAVSFLPLLGGYLRVRRGELIGTGPVHFWSSALGVLVLLLIARGILVDPTSAWWYILPLVALSILAGVLVSFLHAPEYGMVSYLLLAGGIFLFLLRSPWLADISVHYALLLPCCGAALVWVVVEPRMPRRLPTGSWIDNVVTLLLLAWGVKVGHEFSQTLLHAGFVLSPWSWVVAASLGLMLILSLWDSLAKDVLLRAYLWVLVLFAMVSVTVPPRWRWVLLPVVAGLLLFIEWVRLRSVARRWQEVLRIPEHNWPTGWLSVGQRALACLVLAGSVAVVLYFESVMRRLGGPLALVVLLPALLLAARRQQGAARTSTLLACLALIPVIVAEVLWAPLDTSGRFVWLERAGYLLTMSGLFHLVYYVVYSHSAEPLGNWDKPLRLTSVTLAVAAMNLLFLLVVGELALVRGRGALPLESSLAIGLGVGCLLGSLLCIALKPGTSPVPLTRRYQLACVYAAEVLAVVLYLHFRFSQPHWFTGRLSSMWTYLAIAAAFAIALLSEGLRRFRVDVLSEPFFQTSLLLALVPVLGYHFRPVGNYALLWLLVSLLYALVAMSRQSMTLGMLSILFSNIGLWAWLDASDRSFQDHPQLWLVPFSISVLIGAQVNRDRLNRGQLAGLRYLGLTMMYLASAWETFLIGLGEDVTRPLILIGLALVGVGMGMFLRVKAFLFLGVGFLFLGIFGLVWHTAIHQGWIWPVAGIVLGFLIIAMFAVFEKRRNDILAMLGRLREWE